MQMFGNLFSLLGARAFAAWGSPLVFENFLAVGFRQKIAAGITATGTADLTEIVEKYAGFLPESFRTSIIDTFERSVTAALENNAVLLADSIVTNVIEPLITPVISIVLFFVAFAVCRTVVSMLVTVLGLVNKLPVIGTVNRTLGWGMGFATALLDVFFGVCIVWALIVITGGGISWLNETALGSSVFYRLFNVLNPFV
jgi:hypothetical protein